MPNKRKPAAGLINDNEQSAPTRSPPQPNMLAFLLPLFAFMFLAGLSPSFQGDETAPGAATNYLYLVIVQVVVAAVFVGSFWRTYSAHFPFKVDNWGFIAGVVGVVLWIVLCSFNIERTLADSVGLSNWLPERSGFNPYEHFPDDLPRWLFLGFRFTLLALMVPIIEELFLRGWFVRFIDNPDWHLVSLANIGTRGIVAAAIYGVATHPAEAIAAAIWFSLVSWLMVKTGKFWNCVVAHAVTNFLLGIYVLVFSEWHLW